MSKSFRTRLFLIAVLILGSVVSAVLILGWSSVLAVELERLDKRLCMEARRLATQPLQLDGIDRLQTDMMGKLHLSSPDQLMLRYQSTTGGENFQSVNWLKKFEPNQAQWRTEKSDDQVASAEPAKNLRLNRRSDQPPNPPSEQPPRERPRGPPEGRSISMGSCSLASFDDQGRQWHVARLPTDLGLGLIAADIADTQAELKNALSQALKFVVPLALVLAALGAWLLSVFMMRPIYRLSNAMKGVTQNALDQRLSTTGEDREFKGLIDAYNTMLGRLEASFQQASRFSADAAHELKTPLTILQGRIEQARNKSDQPMVQAELTELLDEVGRLSVITRKLLLLSQADAGSLTLQRTSIDLSSLLDESAADMQMLLIDQTLKCDVDRQLLVQGDAVLLQQLFNNLISNAVRYCLPDGLIHLSAHRLGKSIEVQITNTTHPISVEDRARFFDRFFRGDAAHNRRIDGNGLGLSLASEISLAHGGALILTETESNVVIMRLTLPLG